MAAKKKNSSPLQVLLPLILLLAALLWYSTQPTQTITVPPGDFLFCFWNVENFFDNQDDRRNRIDEEYDNWFAQDSQAFQLKLQKLTDVLLNMNDGKGPDILALAEVESQLAAEQLKDALNARLPKEASPYVHVLMDEVKVGRHIAPAIITRLPVIQDRTRQYDKRRRILEGRLKVNGKELVVIAAHWTSRVEGGAEGRAAYADLIYGHYKAMYLSNPNVDVLICGDFNDNPEDVSVTEHLHATGKLALVRGSSEPLLYNLMADKDRQQYGTHYYQGWHTFDQLIVSPGMLDGQGWMCAPSSVQVVKLSRPKDKLGRPWRFGSRSDDPSQRGYSDHFPVTLTLSVDKLAPASTAASEQ